MLINIVKSTRPMQWTKSFFVFFPFFFSINEAWGWNDYGNLFSILINLTLTLVVFTLASSSIYLMNDVIDRDKDRLHPQKRFRPIASGQLEPKPAMVSSAIICLFALILSLMVNLSLLAILLAYLILMIGYGFIFRNIVLVDVTTISIGFVMRVWGGAVAIDVPVSFWLCVCMGFGALFIASCKRLAEGSQDSCLKSGSRKTLNFYKPNLLKVLVCVILIFTLVLYSFYVLTAPNLPSNNSMMFTAPFVGYGMLRYLYLVLRKGRGDKPEEIIVKDIPLIGCVLLWLVSVIVILNLYR